MFARIKPRRMTARPVLEALEDRTLLSPGDLDAAFGTGGLVVADLGDAEQGKSVAIQDDGKIVVAGFQFATESTNVGAFALARFNPDGSLDDGTAMDSTAGDSFGTAGKTFTDIGTGFDIANAVLVYPASSAHAGKILVAGRASTNLGVQFGIARYNTDGKPDDGNSSDGTPDITPSDGFGTGGVVTTDFGFGFSEATSLVVQSDGKIVVAGAAATDRNFTFDFALARYEPDGSLDGSFGTSGLVTTGFGVQLAAALDVALQPDGLIVAAGYADNTAGTLGYQFALARYNANGSLDATFGSEGRVTMPFVGSSQVRVLAI